VENISAESCPEPSILIAPPVLHINGPAGSAPLIVGAQRNGLPFHQLNSPFACPQVLFLSDILIVGISINHGPESSMHRPSHSVDSPPFSWPITAPPLFDSLDIPPLGRRMSLSFPDLQRLFFPLPLPASPWHSKQDHSRERVRPSQKRTPHTDRLSISMATWKRIVLRLSLLDPFSFAHVRYIVNATELF